MPLCIYGVMAMLCWLSPSRLMVDEETFVINVFPTKAFALARVALAIVHWALAISGRVVVGVAGSWAVAMTSLIMTIVVEYLAAASTLQTAPTRSGIMLVQVLRPVQILTVGGTACALSVLAWQLVRRRLSVGAHVMARGFVVLGLAGLVFSCACWRCGRRVCWQRRWDSNRRQA